MTYTILQLANLAGVSTRTLRYYDQIGLLSPTRNPESDYRIYGKTEVDVLQQILFYKELGFELSAIKGIMSTPDFDFYKALQQHLSKLEEKQQHIGLLIDTVKKTLKKEEGIITMTDKEKFAGLKKALLDENEAQYGEEIRETYGEDTVAASNQKFMNLSEEEYNSMQSLSEDILKTLERAVKNNLAPDSAKGKDIAFMHKNWLGYTWPAYSPEAHRGLADMYAADERFKAYYDKNVPGCAEFLRNCIHSHIS